MFNKLNNLFEPSVATIAQALFALGVTVVAIDWPRSALAKVVDSKDGSKTVIVNSTIIFLLFHESLDQSVLMKGSNSKATQQ